MKILYRNKKALFNYFIEDKYEAGIILSGTEVKSCKLGHIDLSDSFISIDKGDLILNNSFIADYKHSGYSKHIEKCKRKLLMHKKEILKLHQEVNIKGYTLIPLSFYENKGLIKVEVALAKGKHTFDKRESLKEKTSKREIERFLK
jgi:SsrA-binding protein